MENSKKNDIIVQSNNGIVNEKIDFIKEFNDLKNNKIVQIAVTTVVSFVKRRKK